VGVSYSLRVLYSNVFSRFVENRYNISFVAHSLYNILMTITSLDSYRRLMNHQQTVLRELLQNPAQFEQGMRLFFTQHAMLHSAQVAEPPTWSYEDTVLAGIPEAQYRLIPEGQEHTIAWLLWHMARCEDITMNLLVAGSPQVLLQNDWLKKMRTSMVDTGNAMTREEILSFSEQIDLPALREYRLAVGKRTREIALGLTPADLIRKVDPARMELVWQQGAIIEASRGIAEYWGKRDMKGLLLMPASRHLLTHLNEILEIKKTLG
jgi:hypothetical protein